MFRSIKDCIRRAHVGYLRARGRRKPELEAGGRTVIVAPHPDDEVLGCGGLIARLVARGLPPHVVILTGGEGSHRGCCKVAPEAIVAARRELTLQAASTLGLPADHLHWLSFADGSIGPDNREEAARLAALLAELRPATVLVPHWGEGWPDHLNAARLTRAAAPEGTAVVEYCVWMWYYNVWRGLDWKNAYALRLTPDEHALKLRAAHQYVIPTAPCGKPWSGVLPPLFLRAVTSNVEIYFKSK